MKFRSSLLPSSGALGFSVRLAMAGALAALGGNAYALVDAPVFNPPEGDSMVQFNLVVTCPTPGAQIYYTLNGAEPTKNDIPITSGGSIVINRKFTVKAKAWSTTEESTTTSAVYTVTGDISAGGSHSLAMKSAGAAFAWGLRTDGRLADNVTTGTLNSPIASKYLSTSAAITDATMVAAGMHHSIFLKNNGTVWGSGVNTAGAVGDNTLVNKAMAVQVKTGTTASLLGIVGIAAGDSFSVAVNGSTGLVYSWGSRTSGRLGDGLTTPAQRAIASAVFYGTSGSNQLTGISKISAAGGTALALNPTTGNVWAWGDNTGGQLGQGNVTALTRALKVKLNSTTDLTDAWDISNGTLHSAVVRWKAGDPLLQGRVYTFGQQQYGRLGNNQTASGTVTYPVEVVKSGGAALDGIVSVAAGSVHTLALDLDGKVWAWGRNGWGALGDNTNADRGFAAKVKNPAGTGDLENIIRIAAGGNGLANFSMAVAADGTVYTWGCNNSGQLANVPISATNLNKLPVAVTGSFDLLPNPPDVTLSSIINKATDPGSVTFVAAPTDADNNISKVEFYDQGVKVGEATSAPWMIHLNDRALGSHHAYAVVTDTTGYRGYSLPLDYSITHPLPTVTLSTSVTLSTAPGAVTLTASPSDPNNTITGVDFYSQGVLVGQLTSAPWTINLSSLAADEYEVQAKVTNSASQVGESALAYFTITSTAGGASVDADGDGLTVEQENLLGTSDRNMDTDGDGVPDNIDGNPKTVNRVNFISSALLVTSPLR